MIALFSIKPEYVNKILSGEKYYEYRKVIFKKKVTKIVIYCTMPVGKIIGEFEVEDILSGRPDEIWERTREYSGVNEEFYVEYFQGKEVGYAIKIGTKNIYKEPINPKNVFPSFTPPQSFFYLSSFQHGELLA